MLFLMLSIGAAQPADARLLKAVTQAIRDETQHGISATKAKNIDQYMEGIPADYRVVEDDGSITDRETLRAKQLQAWAIIPRTNSLRIDVTRVELGCGDTCAKAWTDQRWDRQMMGRDGKTEFNVVTTQKHEETWELRGPRWRNTKIVELGGTTTVDGKPY